MCKNIFSKITSTVFVVNIEQVFFYWVSVHIHRMPPKGIFRTLFNICDGVFAKIITIFAKKLHDRCLTWS